MTKTEEIVQRTLEEETAGIFTVQWLETIAGKVAGELDLALKEAHGMENEVGGAGRHSVESLLEMLELQEQVIDNPWKKGIVKKHLSYMREEIRFFEREGKCRDAMAMAESLNRRFTMLQVTNKMTSWETKWLKTLISLLTFF